MTAALIRREPVVNRQQTMTASRLIVHAASAADAAETLAALADGWPEGLDVFVGFDACLPDPDLLAWRPPANALIEISAQGLESASTVELAGMLSAADVPLCLDGYAPGMALPSGLHWRFALIDARSHPAVTGTPGVPLAKGLADTAAFAAAIDHGYAGAAGSFFLHGRPVSDKLNPSHGQIVRALNLVRGNADIKDIEAALKHDLSLSYKLLRYINSAGFGLSCEIQSFRHAVTILGYAKLNKWLSLLLVTASKDPAAPVLMQTAIARGRFMEIVGAGFFDALHADNLFVTGAFSLLHVLLGTRLEVVLDEMKLPEAITDALLHNRGVYAPFLQLALACEGDDAAVLAALADELVLTTMAINRAQLQALSFAAGLAN
jgi:EAL and modified HD-GYP domain-containing signal transduction protein